jgi:HTH-type transcriptional regulator/antitoxin HigA
MASTSLDFSIPHVLRNAREHRVAVAEIDELLDQDPRRGTAAYDRLEFLSVLVQAYEDARFPLDELEAAGSPQTVVDFMLEQHGMSRGDLAAIMGGKSRVSEFFAGKRRLSVDQIKALRDALGIPADLLIG